MMNYDKGERLLLKTLDIQESITGKDHPDYVLYESYLASLYLSMGDHGAAEGLLSNLLGKQRILLGEDHPDTAHTQAMIARIYYYKGDYSSAESLLREAIKSELQNPLRFASNLLMLAYIYKSKGDYKVAESLILRVMEIYSKLGRENNFDYVDLMVDLAELFVASNRIQEAKNIMKKVFVIENKSIDMLFSISSDIHRLNYITNVQWHLHVFISLVLEYFYDSMEAIMTAMDSCFAQSY